jgi:hypothetical protein
MGKRVIFVRDPDGTLTSALEREVARRRIEGGQDPDRPSHISVTSVVSETLRRQAKLWDDPRRGGAKLRP